MISKTSIALYSFAMTDTHISGSLIKVPSLPSSNPPLNNATTQTPLVLRATRLIMAQACTGEFDLESVKKLTMLADAVYRRLHVGHDLCLSGVT